jgi:hypothetical protein
MTIITVTAPTNTPMGLGDIGEIKPCLASVAISERINDSNAACGH